MIVKSMKYRHVLVNMLFTRKNENYYEVKNAGLARSPYIFVIIANEYEIWKEHSPGIINSVPSIRRHVQLFICKWLIWEFQIIWRGILEDTRY